MSDDGATPEGILDFWFGTNRRDAVAQERRSQVWFTADAAFDADVRTRYTTLVERAGRGELRRWKLSPEGTLALILLFDQFPRNIYRSTPRAFHFDARALALCRDGIAMGVDLELAIIERAFFYLPLEHAEDREAQEKSVACFERLHRDADGAFKAITASNLEYARGHRDIVQRFGRFPHRNLILGRTSSADEIAWIATHRDGFGQA